MLSISRSSSMRRIPVTGKTAFILAHPDDETVTGVGYLGKVGKLARFQALNGVLNQINRAACKLPQSFTLSRRLAEIRAIQTPILYYATLGENGNHNGVREDEDLKVVRYDELQKAASILGTTITLGHFQDGRLKENRVALERSIFDFLEREKPDRVITFPPTGITKHPDHEEISHATLHAVETYNQRHSDEKISLYFRVIQPDDRGITGRYVYHDDLPATHCSKVSRTLFSRKKIAEVIQSHQTQVPEMGTIFPSFGKFAKKPTNPPDYKGDEKKIWKKETFHQRI